MQYLIPDKIERTTPLGPVWVRAFFTPGEIQSFRFDTQFRSYAQYKSLFTRRQTLEDHAAIEGVNVTLALSRDDLIIGFGVLNHAEPDQRWTALGHSVMMEVKVIEVGREWRNFKIANDIMKMLLTHPRLEQMIVYMVGYSWTWDLDGTAMTAQQYRNMLIRLFGKHGFQEFQTNEPNICLKPENLFLGRVGRNVPEKTRKAFKWLCFGITP